ncbi:unnamed protein product [Cylindrotheca closterium]|uniref:Kinesin light chain n=1 Tax=Cylindrotheca closterium TaxID=2856 RepID=A0AAD2FNZ5_9STRA|nr:unnamed protein product [Cylindrotheca closterium]
MSETLGPHDVPCGTNQIKESSLFYKECEQAARLLAVVTKKEKKHAMNEAILKIIGNVRCRGGEFKKKKFKGLKAWFPENETAIKAKIKRRIESDLKKIEIEMSEQNNKVKPASNRVSSGRKSQGEGEESLGRVLEMPYHKISKKIGELGPYDVPCGSNASGQGAEGFHSDCSYFALIFPRLSKEEKDDAVQRIINSLEKRGGKFKKKMKDVGWVEESGSDTVVKRVLTCIANYGRKNGVISTETMNLIRQEVLCNRKGKEYAVVSMQRAQGFEKDANFDDSYYFLRTACYVYKTMLVENVESNKNETKWNLARTYRRLAEVLVDNGQKQGQALPYFEMAARACEELKHWDTLGAIKCQIAHCYKRKGDRSTADRMLQEAHDYLFSARWPLPLEFEMSDPTAKLFYYQYSANLLRGDGKHEASLDHYERSCLLQPTEDRQFSQDDHDNFLNISGKAYHGIGMAYTEQGKYDEADTYLRRSMSQLLKRYGPNHPEYTDNYLILAKGQMMRGKIGNARYLLENYLNLYRDKPAHPSYPFGLGHLGKTWEKEKNYREALNVYIRALELNEARIGKGIAHLDVAYTLNSIANCLRKDEKFDDASDTCKRAYETLRKLGYEDDGDHPTMVYNRNLHGRICSRDISSTYDETLLCT